MSIYINLFYRGVHSPSDVLSPFSQKISSERNSALKKYQKLHVTSFNTFVSCSFKPKSLMDKLLSVKSSSQSQLNNSSSNKSKLTSANDEDAEEHEEEDN